MEDNIRRKKVKTPSRLPYIIIAIVYVVFAVAVIDIASKQCIARGNDISSVDYKALFAAMSYILHFKSYGLVPLKYFFIVAKNTWFVHIVAFCIIYMFSIPTYRNTWKGEEYGSQKWANAAEKAQFANPTGQALANNFYMQSSTKPYNKVEQYVAKNNNIAVIGDSGASKTFRHVAPRLMSIIRNGENFVLTDPKGETARNCIKLLKREEYDYKILNFYNIECSDHYNPFVYARSETDILRLAEIVMNSTAGKDDKKDFWSLSAQFILTAIMTYIYETDTETLEGLYSNRTVPKNFYEVVRFLTTLEFTGGRVSPNCEYYKAMEAFAARVRQEGKVSVAVLNWGSVKATVEQTLSGEIATLINRMSLWTTSAVANATADDEMCLDDFCKPEGRKAIIIITPPADSTFDAVVSMFYTQLYSYLQYKTTTPELNGRLPVLLNCIMDEFANCSKIPDVEKVFQVVRSYNISVDINIQNISQLKARYKDSWSDILAACSYLIYLGGTEPETTKYVSEQLGKTTIEVQTRTYNHTDKGGSSENINKKERSLLDPAELINFTAPTVKNPIGRCVIIVDGSKRFALSKYDTTNDDLYQSWGADARFENSKNNTDIIADAIERRKRIKKREEKKDTVAVVQPSTNEITAEQANELRAVINQGKPLFSDEQINLAKTAEPQPPSNNEQFVEDVDNVIDDEDEDIESAYISSGMDFQEIAENDDIF